MGYTYKQINGNNPTYESPLSRIVQCTIQGEKGASYTIDNISKPFQIGNCGFIEYNDIQIKKVALNGEGLIEILEFNEVSNEQNNSNENIKDIQNSIEYKKHFHSTMTHTEKEG